MECMKDSPQRRSHTFLGATIFFCSEAEFCLGSLLAPDPEASTWFLLSQAPAQPLGPASVSSTSPSSLAAFRAVSWLCCPTPEWLCLPACTLASGSPAQLLRYTVDAVEGDRPDPAVWPSGPKKGLNSNHGRKGDNCPDTACTFLLRSCGMGGPVSPALSPMEARDL